MSARFNHLYTLAFTVDSLDEHGDDVTSGMLLVALMKRIAYIHETASWDEAVGAPEDTARLP